jgi:L-fuconolactonase
VSHVHVKLGGLGMRIGGFDFHKHADPPSSATLAAAWRPYIETAIEAFGPAFDVREQLPGRQRDPVFWNACKLLAGGLSRREKADLFAGTAAPFYCLDLAGLG